MDLNPLATADQEEEEEEKETTTFFLFCFIETIQLEIRLMMKESFVTSYRVVNRFT